MGREEIGESRMGTMNSAGTPFIPLLAWGEGVADGEGTVWRKPRRSGDRLAE
jgi:hypothetical protein